jgi:hypothetical protein
MLRDDTIKLRILKLPDRGPPSDRTRLDDVGVTEVQENFTSSPTLVAAYRLARRPTAIPRDTLAIRLDKP